MKTSELTGAALDWAVAKCETWVIGTTDDDLVSFVLEDSANEMHFWPSTDWSQGGPIIEREGISVFLRSPHWPKNNQWSARQEGDASLGPTPLIAAMRRYVAFKLGDNVDIPPELEI